MEEEVAARVKRSLHHHQNVVPLGPIPFRIVCRMLFRATVSQAESMRSDSASLERFERASSPCTGGGLLAEPERHGRASPLLPSTTWRASFNCLLVMLLGVSLLCQAR